VANNFLCRFQADILGRDVIRPKVTELTSLGAAFLAGLAVGVWKDSARIRSLWEEDKVFRPRLSPARAESLYQGWQAAVRRTLSTVHA